MPNSASETGAPGLLSPDARRRLQRRYVSAIILLCVLVGMMIGHLTAPAPVALQRISADGDMLLLTFNREPSLSLEHQGGALVLHIGADVAPFSGRYLLSGQPVRLTIVTQGRGSSLLRVVAAAGLQAVLSSTREGDGWMARIRVSTAPSVRQ